MCAHRHAPLSQQLLAIRTSRRGMEDVPPLPQPTAHSEGELPPDPPLHLHPKTLTSRVVEGPTQGNGLRERLGPGSSRWVKKLTARPRPHPTLIDPEVPCGSPNQRRTFVLARFVGTWNLAHVHNVCGAPQTLRLFRGGSRPPHPPVVGLPSPSPPPAPHPPAFAGSLGSGSPNRRVWRIRRGV